MEFEAFATLLTGQCDDIKQGVDKLKPGAKPIHKPVGGSAIGTGASPLMVVLEQTPQAGRIWNVLRVGIFGSDPHTPVVSSTVQTVAFSAGSSNNVSLPPGAQLTGFDVTMSSAGTAPGTVTVSQVENTVGVAASPVWNIPTGATSVTARFSPPLQNPVGDANGIRVGISAITGGGAGNINVYSTGVCVTDFYSTASGEVLQPPYPDVIANNMTIPSIQSFSRQVEWCRYGEQLVALVYGVPTGQQVVAVARIAEYPVETVEAMRV